MLNKKRRINKTFFNNFFKKGFVYYGKNLSIKIAKDKDKNSESKFGISVPKKELKTAVKRNLLKRRVSSILRKIEPKINLGFICVFFLKKGALDLSYQKLQEEVVFLLEKAKII